MTRVPDRRQQPSRRRAEVAQRSTVSPFARWPLLAALIVFTALVYQPAWHGTLLWDDAAHVTRPELRSGEGLARIWSEVGATQQYYPLTHSVFWIQAQLWGDTTTGYHLVSIALHATAAWLLAIVMTHLGIPGAILAAFLFAAHPVHVESVAWISELKNTLSAVFLLAATVVYVRWDRERRTGLYFVSAALFVCALLAKTVTASFPAAMLVVVWWQRGTVSWTRDVRPLLAFFAMAIAAGVMTTWVERVYIGAEGSEFALTLGERLQVAGRAFWFYLGKLVWPTDLTFVYPRWRLDAGGPGNYAFVAAAGIAGVIAWSVRRISRAPLAILLLFGGMLFPALGFVDVFPFRYSFVADHFQYHASLAVIGGAAAAIVLLLRQRVPDDRLAIALPALLAVVLGILSWRQAHDYVSAEALYRATLARNPDAWLAHNNLALLLRGSGRSTQARPHLEAAVRLNPRVPEHHANLGRLELEAGNPDAALVSFDRALERNERLPDVHSDRGVALLRRGQVDEALAALARAQQLAPGHAQAQANLADAERERGILRMRRGERAAAIQDFEEAVRRRTDVAVMTMLARARHEYGVTLHESGRTGEAVTELVAAARILPSDPSILNDAGVALLAAGRANEAIAAFEAALRLEPGFAAARQNLARARRSTR